MSNLQNLKMSCFQVVSNNPYRYILYYCVTLSDFRFYLSLYSGEFDAHEFFWIDSYSDIQDVAEYTDFYGNPIKYIMIKFNIRGTESDHYNTYAQFHDRSRKKNYSSFNCAFK